MATQTLYVTVPMIGDGKSTATAFRPNYFGIKNNSFYVAVGKTSLEKD